MNTAYWDNATPEQKLLWDYAKTQLAFNTITPLVYFGAIAGSEFLTWNISKLYLAVEIEFEGYVGSVANAKQVAFYNVGNVLINTLMNNAIYWNATTAAPNYGTNVITTKNFVFGRLAQTGPAIIKFIGYRLTIV